MALFQRRKRNDDGDKSEPAPTPPAVAPDPPAGSTPTETPAATPTVQVGVSLFRGMGAPAGPTLTSADAATATSGVDPALSSTPDLDPSPATGAPAEAIAANGEPGTPGAPVTVPRPPAEASTVLETVPGVRDNVLLRDALAALGERPSGNQLLNVLRQLMQGHVFLRVPGDAQELLAQGGPLPLALLTNAEGKRFVMLFSSGRALSEAAKQGDDLGTAAIAQPVAHAMKAVLGGDFHGVVLDHGSSTGRAVLPRELLQKAFDEADPTAAIKMLLAGPRTSNTADDVVRAMRAAPMWVAIKGTPGVNAEGQPRMGIAESRTANGERFVEVFSHPLEVAALGRGDRAMPFTVQQLARSLRDHPELTGVLVDTGGPWVQLRRDSLAPLLSLADESPE